MDAKARTLPPPPPPVASQACCATPAADNHIWSSGSISSAVCQARKVAGHATKIEVECRSLDEAVEAVRAGCATDRFPIVRGCSSLNCVMWCAWMVAVPVDGRCGAHRCDHSAMQEQTSLCWTTTRPAMQTLMRKN